MKKIIYELQARKGFACAGTECEHDCCHGWDQIAIDNETMSAWQMKNDSVKQELLELVNFSDPDFPVLKSSQKVCLALDAKGLCNVQLKYGHETLPEICRIFPRLDFDCGSYGYQSASLSCPTIVKNAVFGEADLFIETSEESSGSDTADSLRVKLDQLLQSILGYDEYSAGIKLFFIADIFSEIIQGIELGNVSEYDVLGVQAEVGTYLSEIRKAVKQNKLKPNPVTSGSFWKTIYDYCNTREIDQRFLENEGAPLSRVVAKCDNSFAGFSKIYSVIKQYRKQSNKPLRKFSNQLLRYASLIFVNKGFPVSKKMPLIVQLVESMINICLLQLLVWIEINKHGEITEEFLREAIIEVDRRSVLSNVLIDKLENDQHMMKINQYCNAFLDLL